MSVKDFLFFGLMVALPFCVSLIIPIFLFRKRKKWHRTPLTNNLLRSPGESIRFEIGKVDDKFDDLYFGGLFLFCVAFLFFLFSLKISVYGFSWALPLSLLLYLCVILWTGYRFFMMLKLKANLSLGLDAELAVGQELNHLMLQGCRVYHDFPAEEFNIDHVVVSENGVFAVETKGRAKPNKGRGVADAKVLYDGKTLQFPDWQETKPLEQAKRQAVWLSKWLTSAVGSKVVVIPVLAVPGWFVERKKPGDVIVINGKSPSFLPQLDTHVKLSSQQMQQIAHQLEQRCRNIEPSAYRKKRGMRASGGGHVKSLFSK